MVLDRHRLPNVTLIGTDCVDVDRLVRAAEISNRGLEFGAVRLLSSLPCVHPWVEPIERLGDIEAYNDFAVKRLHAYVPTPIALVIQHDGFVLNPNAWSDEFLEWDYIGACWGVDGQAVVGNGGFSLRSKTLLERLAQPDIVRPPRTPEDWFICVTLRDTLEREGLRFAPPSIAQRFSFEGDPLFGAAWSGQLGFHGLTWTDISAWLRDNPHEGILNDLDAETRALIERDARMD